MDISIKNKGVIPRDEVFFQLPVCRQPDRTFFETGCDKLKPPMISMEGFGTNNMMRHHHPHEIVNGDHVKTVVNRLLRQHGRKVCYGPINVTNEMNSVIIPQRMVLTECFFKINDPTKFNQVFRISLVSEKNDELYRIYTFRTRRYDSGLIIDFPVLPISTYESNDQLMIEMDFTDDVSMDGLSVECFLVGYVVPTETSRPSSPSRQKWLTEMYHRYLRTDTDNEYIDIELDSNSYYSFGFETPGHRYGVTRIQFRCDERALASYPGFMLRGLETNLPAGHHISSLADDNPLSGSGITLRVYLKDDVTELRLYSNIGIGIALKDGCYEQFDSYVSPDATSEDGLANPMTMGGMGASMTMDGLVGQMKQMKIYGPGDEMNSMNGMKVGGQISPIGMGPGPFWMNNGIPAKIPMGDYKLPVPSQGKIKKDGKKKKPGFGFGPESPKSAKTELFLDKESNSDQDTVFDYDIGLDELEECGYPDDLSSNLSGSSGSAEEREKDKNPKFSPKTERMVNAAVDSLKDTVGEMVSDQLEKMHIGLGRLQKMKD